jgi:hypothetical protein
LRALIIRRCPVAAISSLATLLVCCAAEGWGGSGLSCLLPALLLGCVLLARRYPGERVLIALHGERGARWPRLRRSMSPRRDVVLVALTGGLLMGRSLAVRPPPASLVAS